MPGPEISVVIPTCRRPHIVQRAVRSVLNQSYSALEIVVVIDGIDDGTRAALAGLDDGRLRVIETGRNRGPAAARNAGVQVAVGKYVALLDDDDEWWPEKLARQLERMRKEKLEDREFLISCRVTGRTPGGDFVWPERLYRMGDDLSEYLLDRRSPFARPGMLCSGTLLFPRSLALRAPLPEDAVHEDWSWLLLLAREAIPIVMCDEPLFIYHLNPQATSQNMGAPWRASLLWARQYRATMSGAAFAGLLSSTTARRARQQGTWRDLIEIGRIMRREGNPGQRHWLMLGVLLLLPGKFAETLRRLSFRSEHSLGRS